jgi:hypothetical protein
MGQRTRQIGLPNPFLFFSSSWISFFLQHFKAYIAPRGAFLFLGKQK